MKFLSWSNVIKKEENKKLLVLFMVTSWCEFCNEQERVLNDIEELDGVFFVKEDADERLDLAVRYTPQIYPSISLITHDSVLGGSYGLVDKEKIVEMINEALKLLEGEGKLITPPKICKSYDKFSPNYALKHILRTCEGYFDWKDGGFEKEPKHVYPEVLQLFLNIDDYYHKVMVETTLDSAIEYLWEDGFYLYSKTIDWKDPYRAKLLDYNAEMVKTLLRAYEVLKNEVYLDYAVKTAEWLLRKKRRDNLFINFEFKGEEDQRPFLNVNANVADALLEAYKVTKDNKFLDAVRELDDALITSHRIDTLSKPYLIDLSSYINFLSKFNTEKAKRVLNFLEDYKANEYYYDVTIDFANQELIGRYAFLYDNIKLAEAFLNLNLFEDAKKIVDNFLSSYGIYTYFNQPKYALLLGEVYGLFTH